MEWVMPRAMRPKRTEILTIARFLEDDAYLDMTLNELLAICMKESGGSINPTGLKELWQQLKAEAVARGE